MNFSLANLSSGESLAVLPRDFTTLLRSLHSSSNQVLQGKFDVLERWWDVPRDRLRTDSCKRDAKEEADSSADTKGKLSMTFLFWAWKLSVENFTLICSSNLGDHLQLRAVSRGFSTPSVLLPPGTKSPVKWYPSGYHFTRQSVYRLGFISASGMAQLLSLGLVCILEECIIIVDLKPVMYVCIIIILLL